MYSITVTSQPSIEPVTVTTLQNYLRVNTTVENSLLAGFITTARALFERSANLALITQTMVQTLEHNPPHICYLMRGPIQSITSVKYYNQAGSLITADPSTYNTDLVTGGMGRLWFPNGQPTMSTLIRPAFQVTFQAGFGDTAADVPQPICQAILLCAAYYFENRAAYTDATIKSVPQGFEAIVDMYKVGNNYQWGLDRHNNHCGNMQAYPWGYANGGWY